MSNAKFTMIVPPHLEKRALRFFDKDNVRKTSSKKITEVIVDPDATLDKPWHIVDPTGDFKPVTAPAGTRSTRVENGKTIVSDNLIPLLTREAIAKGKLKDFKSYRLA